MLQRTFNLKVSQIKLILFEISCLINLKNVKRTKVNILILFRFILLYKYSLIIIIIYIGLFFYIYVYTKTYFMQKVKILNTTTIIFFFFVVIQNIQIEMREQARSKKRRAKKKGKKQGGQAQNRFARLLCVCFFSIRPKSILWLSLPQVGRYTIYIFLSADISLSSERL